MADNVGYTPGAGATVAADDVGGALYQRVKLSIGDDGTVADAPSGGGAEAGALRVTIASDSTGLVSIDDNGGSLTVDGTVAITLASAPLTIDGTVTVTQGTATNLKAQAESYQGGAAVGAANPLQVTLANGTVPSHAVTNAGTFAVQCSVVGSALTALEIISSAVYVDDTGTHSTGASKVMLMGAAATPTDAAVNANDIGALSMTVNRELLIAQGTATSLKTQAEAYQGGAAVAAGNPLQVTLANGTVPSHAVTNAGTFAVQCSVVGSALTALEIISSSIFTDDTSTHTSGTSKGTAIMAVATPTDAAVDSNDIGMVKMTLNRELFVSMASVTPGTAAGNLGKAEDAGHTTGDTGVMALGVVNSTNANIVDADTDYVPFTSDRAGNQNVRVRKELVIVSVQCSSLTPSATSYTAGDQMGGMIEFKNMTRDATGSGNIVGVMAITGSDNIGAIDLLIFDASVSCAADNAAFVINDTDALKAQALINIAGAYDIGGNRIAQAQNIYQPFVCLASATMYGALITRAGHTFFGSSTDLTLKLFVERN